LRGRRADALPDAMFDRAFSIGVIHSGPSLSSRSESRAAF
jgi:hypothetical protein